MRTFTVIAIAAAAVALVLAQAGSAGPGRLAGLVGGNVVRAEVVVMENGVAHDYRIDRGVVRSFDGGSLTLRERDGTVVVVPLAANVQVLGAGRRIPQLVLQRSVGRVATTIRDGDAPAAVVRVGA